FPWLLSLCFLIRYLVHWQNSQIFLLFWQWPYRTFYLVYLLFICSIMLNAKLKNYLLLHLIVFIWGFTAVLGALISLDAIPLVWFRMLLAAVFLGIFVAVRRINLRVTKKLLRTLI